MSGDPTNIGNYRILAKLGGGGMATVFRALQLGLKREVALKVIIPQLASDPKFCERFLRESQAGALINHPNVITCFDAGQADGQLYLAMELVTGGDLEQLAVKRGGSVEESLALTLLRDAAAGLEAVEGAGLVHRDIKPANIFVSDKGVAKLADLGLVHFSQGDDKVTHPGTIMGTPAYIAPEQAQGVADIDIRADIYSLGATLFHLLTGRPPFSGDSPLATLVKAINDPFPDPRSLRQELSAAVSAVVLMACHKDRARRYSCARHLREDLACALEGNPLRHAKSASTSVPAPSAKPSNPGTEKNHPAATPTPPVPGAGKTPAPVLRVDPAQLKLLTKRLIIDKQGLTASLTLAPGASFPRFLLDQILEAAGITFGLIQGSINDATRPSQTPRRIVLAQGDPPSPGLAGKGVRGEKIPPIDQPLIFLTADDGGSCVALTRLGELITREQLEPVLKASGIRYGLDVSALHQLVEGPPAPNGRLVIARGRTPVPGEAGGFVLAENVANTTIDDLGSSNLKRVSAGSPLGAWIEGSDGIPGMNVLGQPIPFQTCKRLKPEDCIGEGTELGRDGSGQLVLRATRNGLCQRQLSGSVRVVGAVEINGDLTASSPPVETNDVVVIRGSVQPGARIISASDVVILGDLNDAHITAGGSLQVQGNIGPGQKPVMAGETIAAGSISLRRVMAGNLRITGTVSHCDLLASGDIVCERVIGGSLTAGSNLTVNTAGDRNGTPTELWAGHNLSYQDQSELVKLAEQRHNAERERLVADCKVIEIQLEDTERKNRLLSSAQYVRRDVAEQMKIRLDLLRQNQQAASQASEAARKELARLRDISQDLRNLGDDVSARLEVAVVAYQGTVLHLANQEPEVLATPRLKVHLGKK